jgi:Flp pilus assembly protein TadD
MNEARKQNLAQHEVVVLALLAHVAIARKDTGTAVRLFQKVLELAPNNGLAHELADAQSALAQIYRERGDLEQA